MDSGKGGGGRSDQKRTSISVVTLLLKCVQGGREVKYLADLSARTLWMTP